MYQEVVSDPTNYHCYFCGVLAGYVELAELNQLLVHSYTAFHSMDIRMDIV